MTAEFLCAELLVFLLVWMHKDWVDRQIKFIHIGWDPGIQAYFATMTQITDSISNSVMIDYELLEIGKRQTATEIEMRMRLHEAYIQKQGERFFGND